MTSSGDNAGNATIGAINVTPLVDVMLVLLVIFMVTAPMMKQGLDVNLPQAAAAPLAGEGRPLVVSVTRAGDLYLNDKPLDLDSLTARLMEIAREHPEQAVYLRADREVRYGAVVGVIAALKSAGIGRLGMLTTAEARR